MENTDKQVLRIEEKLQQLLKQYQLSQKKNQQLHNENIRLKEQLQENIDHKNNLRQQVDTLKINSGTMEESSRKDLEKRINIYLKDIDKCLALLHS